MLHDYILHVKKYVSYKKYVNLQFTPSHGLYAIVSPCPFSIWIFDLIRVINHKYEEGHKFIIIIRKYFTKWVEVMPLRSYKVSQLINFSHRISLQDLLFHQRS